MSPNGLTKNACARRYAFELNGICPSVVRIGWYTCFVRHERSRKRLRRYTVYNRMNDVFNSIQGARVSMLFQALNTNGLSHYDIRWRLQECPCLIIVSRELRVALRHRHPFRVGLVVLLQV